MQIQGVFIVFERVIIMEHSFDIEIAQKYDINTAIILKHLYFWIQKNKANNKHYIEGRYWTYNSKKAFAELFPYMTERQVDYTLKKMVDNGLIIKKQFNKKAYDQTNWYALTDKGFEVIEHRKPAETSSSQNCSIELQQLCDHANEIVRPIPDINTDNKTHILFKKERPQKAVAKKERKTFDEIIEEHTQNEDLRALLKSYLQIRKYARVATTNESLRKCLNILIELTGGDEFEQMLILEQAIRDGTVKLKQWRPTHGNYYNPPAKRSYDLDQYETTGTNYENIFDYISN